MRNEFCAGMAAQAARPDFVFLTGDLGFMALEPLRDALGQRFINAGVAEQNMVSVAAGLARAGLNPWVYSIAPFIYARPYEQIRNDICLHRLPVKIVGNGGGYGYGVMGSTHHAIEDYGALLCLQHMRVFVPAFGEDVAAMLDTLFDLSTPAYLRLGRDEKPNGYSLPTYTPWRRMTTGRGPTVVAIGPLAGSLLAPFAELPEQQRPCLWVVSELPFGPAALPSQFLDDLRASSRLLVAEEHVVQGGLGQMLAECLLLRGEAPKRYAHRAALGYPSGLSGSQGFHRAECGLDAQALVSEALAL